jgi:hypothetical protein
LGQGIEMVSNSGQISSGRFGSFRNKEGSELLALPYDNIDIGFTKFVSSATRRISIEQPAWFVEKSEDPKSKEYRNDRRRANQHVMIVTRCEKTSVSIETPY